MLLSWVCSHTRHHLILVEMIEACFQPFVFPAAVCPDSCEEECIHQEHAVVQSFVIVHVGVTVQVFTQVLNKQHSDLSAAWFYLSSKFCLCPSLPTAMYVPTISLLQLGFLPCFVHRECKVVSRFVLCPWRIPSQRELECQEKKCYTKTTTTRKALLVEQIVLQSNYRINISDGWCKLGRIGEEETEDPYMKVSFVFIFL